MACGPCGARRRRLAQAAAKAAAQPSAKNLLGAASEAAKGAAELLGVKPKTALDEDAKGQDDGK